MTADETIRTVAVAASLISVLVTVGLFLLREGIDSRKRRKRSGITLALFGAITRRALSRNSIGALPFSPKDLFDASSEIVGYVESAELLAVLEDCIHVLGIAAVTKAPIGREERERLISAIDLAIENQNRRLSLGMSSRLLKSPASAGVGTPRLPPTV